MTLELLKGVLPVPANPKETGNASEWRNFELTLGINLPTDYKNYINTYGTGFIGDFIYVLNPFAEGLKINLIQRCGRLLADRRSVREEFGNDEWPYAIFPEQGGLLPWGGSEAGDILYWKTGGDPESWTIVVNEVRTDYFEEFIGPMTLFLRNIITRNIKSNILSTGINRKKLFHLK